MGNVIAIALAGIGAVVTLAVIMAIPMWLLWNWLVPAVFDGPTITLLQALGIGLLSGFLFKSSSSSSS